MAQQHLEEEFSCWCYASLLHFILKVSLLGRADGLSISHFPFAATIWFQSGKFSRQSSILELLTQIEVLCGALLQISDNRLNSEDSQLFGCIDSNHFVNILSHAFTVSGAPLRPSKIYTVTTVSVQYLSKDWGFSSNPFQCEVSGCWSVLCLIVDYFVRIDCVGRDVSEN